MKKKSEINPYLDSNCIKVVKSSSKDKLQNNGSEVEYSSKFFIDLDKSIKVYNIMGFEELVYSLSPKGTKLFFYILFHLRGKSDQIEISEKSISEKTSMGGSSFTKARAELTKKDIIRKVRGGRKNMYWINPHQFFSGNRTAFVKEQYGEDYIWIKPFHQTFTYKDEEEF